MSLCVRAALTALRIALMTDLSGSSTPYRVLIGCVARVCSIARIAMISVVPIVIQHSPSTNPFYVTRIESPFHSN